MVVLTACKAVSIKLLIMSQQCLNTGIMANKLDSNMIKKNQYSTSKQCMFCIYQVKADHRCLYTALRRRLDCPVEYTSTHLKRQIIHYLALRAKEFVLYCNNHILHEYNNDVRRKNFSFKTFLLYMLEEESWGDTITLHAVSILFNLRISVLFPQSLKATLIRHEIKDLAKVDALCLHTGGLHYTAIGKGCRHSFKGLSMW